MTAHLTLELLREVQAGKRGASDLAKAALGHLLDICPHCLRAVEAWRGGEQGDPRTEEKDRSERRPPPECRSPSAFGRLDELIALPPDEWAERVRQAPASYASPAFAQRLLEKVRNLLPDHIPQVYELASLAGLVLQHCSSTPEVVSLYALSIAHKANAVRVQGKISHAQHLIDAARLLIKPYDRADFDQSLIPAEIAALAGSLENTQGASFDSVRSLRRSTRSFLMNGAWTEAARGLITMSSPLLELSRGWEAESSLRDACLLLEKQRASSSLLLMAKHCRIVALCALGQPQLAREKYTALQDLYDEVPSPHIQLRRIWTDGSICTLEGRLGNAEKRMREARDGFRAIHQPFRAAMLSKKLAALYARQGRIREAEALIQEIIPVFEEQEVRNEVDAARRILRDALGNRREVN